MSDTKSFSRRLAHFRYSLAERIVNMAPSETAGLQAALLTGVRRYIPPEQTEALRAAGLAHILAISGLHMGLLAGSAFYVFVLVGYEFFVERLGVKHHRTSLRQYASVHLYPKLKYSPPIL